MLIYDLLSEYGLDQDALLYLYGPDGLVTEYPEMALKNIEGTPLSEMMTYDDDLRERLEEIAAGANVMVEDFDEFLTEMIENCRMGAHASENIAYLEEIGVNIEDLI